MARFKHIDNTQGRFMAVNLSEQIQQGTFEWAVSHIINRTDTSSFEEKYDNDAKGRRHTRPKCF